MANENGEWIMHGMGWDDPRRLRTWREVIGRINEIGFLPLFKNEVPGFSVEEQVSDLFWWTGDPAQDPWVWRALIARTGEVAYGKFFGKKAGFISKEWFPHFANYRRDGYDFDTLWDEEKASMRSKKIMDQFEANEMLPSNELKRLAGFGKAEKRISTAQSPTFRCRPIWLSGISADAEIKWDWNTECPYRSFQHRKPCGVTSTSPLPITLIRQNL